jgi:ferrochelatase
VQIICPGFSADCLETLEEIDLQNRTFFTDAGGKDFSYIPALNDSDEHINVLCTIIESHMQGWEIAAEDLKKRIAQAKKAGAKQ